MTLRINLYIAALFVTFVAVDSFAASRTERMVVVSNGENVGTLVATTSGDSVNVDYRVSENGRGDAYKEAIRFGSANIPVAWKIDGTRPLGARISEVFTWKAGQASWRSQSDDGKVAAPNPQLYVVNADSAWAPSVYTRALLSAPDHRLQVLPSGTATLKSVGKLTVGADGTAVDTVAYRISGIDLWELYVFLDADGRPFAMANSLLISLTIREGYEREADSVLKFIAQVRVAQASEQQRRLSHRFTAPIRIQNVHVFDSRSGKRTGPTTVVVARNRISFVGQDANSPTAHRDEVVIDGEGGTLVPGLTDMHAHMFGDAPLLDLAAGVTSARDMGNMNGYLLDLIQRIESGEAPGPRITANGFIEGRSPFSARAGIVAQSLQEALGAVDWYSDRGYWQIKLYNSINPDWVKPIAEHAHARGMRVTGHVPAFGSADRAIRDGYDEIAHINQLLLQWLLKPGEDPRTPVRMTVLSRTVDLDFQSAQVQSTLDLMKSKDIAIDLTVGAMEKVVMARAGSPVELTEQELRRFPVQFQRRSKNQMVAVNSPAEDARYRESFAKMLTLVKMLHDRGIRVLPGTDDATGVALHRELELYVQAGIAPAQVLSLATMGCAEYLGRGQDLGAIERGRLADFFLIAADPTVNISATKWPRMVIKNGEIYFPSEIYREFGIEPSTLPPPWTLPKDAN